MDDAKAQAAGSGKEPVEALSMLRKAWQRALAGVQTAIFAAAFLLAGGVVGTILIKPIWALVSWLWGAMWPAL